MKYLITLLAVVVTLSPAFAYLSGQPRDTIEATGFFALLIGGSLCAIAGYMWSTSKRSSNQ